VTETIRYRPRGLPRRLATLASPAGLVAGQLAAERGVALRRERLLDAARNTIAQRRRPTRPTMRALIISGGGRLSWRAVAPPPPPGPKGALVRPIAVATCDLDRSLALGATPFPLPLNIGHECVAEVISVGSDVAGVRPGQQVCVPFQINCGDCVPCRSGFTSNCASVPPMSMYGFGLGGGHWGGVLADQVAVPFADAMLVPLPDGVDPVAAASVADTTSDAYRHIGPHLPALLTRDPDAEVLIIAALAQRHLFSASVPLYAGQIARALGARRVLLVDVRPHVREAATRLGMVAHSPKELRRIAPAPLVVAASATQHGTWVALTKTASDGICTCVGSLTRVGKMPAMMNYGRNVTFHLGRSNARAVMPDVLELIASGRFHPEQVITAQGSFDDAPELLGAHYRTQDIKTILTA
jgi:alcohol dehydrogenase